MFKTGFKEIVLNSDPGMLDTAGAAPTAGSSLVVPGYGTFQAGQTVTIVPGVAAKSGEYSIDMTAGGANGAPVIAVGDVVDITLKFSAEAFRFLPEMFSYGELKVISAKITDTALIGENFQAVFDAWNIEGDEFFTQNLFEVAGSGNTLIIKIKKGYEGYELKDVLVNIASAERPEETRMSYSTGIGATTGINTGKEIEAEVRNAQFDNIDPYGIHFGGNDQHVDVRGLYNSYHFSTLTDQADGWAPHAGLGYGDANTETSYIARDYIMYALAGSSADTILATWAA